MRRVVPVVAVVLGVCVACEGDGGELSAREYRAEANEICVGVRERVEAAGRALQEDLGSTGEPSAAQLYELSDRVADDFEGLLADLRDLEGPPDLESDVRSALDEAERILDDLGRRAEEDPDSALTTGGDPFAGVTDRLAELGLRECAE